MNKNLIPISDERDLKIYESRISGGVYNTERIISDKKRSMCEHFVCNKGKLLKVEVMNCNGMRIKKGVLIEVGENFIVLKADCGPVSMVIPFDSIHSVTVVHCH